MGADFFMSI